MMTKEDIIRMAERAGINVDTYGDIWGSTDDGLLRFAALVAEREREACAKVAITTPDPDDEYISVRSAIAAAIRARGGE